MSSDKDTQTIAGRREFMLAAATLAAAPACAQVESPMSDRIPIRYPETEFVYEAIVDIDPGMDLGVGPLGRRGFVPITGGTFEGPNIKGTVMAGGADRQLVRDDGYRMLDALYELQTDDGAVITVRNQVTSPPEGADVRFSVLQITAPEEKYGWLNRSVHVGTLNSLRPERNAVLIRVFRLV
jgi:hypothetical protein